MDYVLRPCPFCGDRAIFNVISTMERRVERGWEFGVSCVNCGASLPKSDYSLRCEMNNLGDIEITTDEREAAAHDWNRRVSDGY